jgi:phage terminase large subunit-like protein
LATETLSYDLQKTIRLLPGYDPFAQAGDCWFDEEAAQFAIDFIETFCTFTKGTKEGKPLKGQPFKLEPWQKAIVANLFGWKRPDGLRRYRECLLFVPRKNGKSELAAAIIVLFMYSAAGLLRDQPSEPGAEIYGAAAKRDQTKYIFDPVKIMIQNEEWLRDRAEIFKHSIVVGDASYHKISSEATTEHGGSTHLGVVDELHAQPDGELVGVLRTSMGQREQPLLLYVTTSDYERQGSPCNQKHEYACKVRDGIIHDPEFLPIIYEAARDADWTDPKVWEHANPNLGVSVRREFLEHECQVAQDDPLCENIFKRLHLNIRTEQSFRWMPMAKWDACEKPVDLDALKGCECWAGLDLASVEDMAAFVLAFPLDDGEYAVLPFYWCPSDTAMERDRKQRMTYQVWNQQGLLELTPGNSTDYRFIRRRVNELSKEYKIQVIAFDPWNASTLVQQLGDEDGFTVQEHRQGTVSMNEPMKMVMRLVREKKLRHGAHPILRWNANNISVKPNPSEDVRPDKEHSADKIDGIVAMIMAVGQAASAPKPKKSPYATRGFLTT